MCRTWSVLVLFVFITSFSVKAQQRPAGSLVIVGGGLEANNKSVFEQMILLAGGPEKAVFAVIPSAGGAPVQSFAYFKSELVYYGVSPEKIHLIPIAVMDDDSTLEVNEAEWKDNGNDLKWAGLIRQCSAVWFTGGDQLRTTRALYLPDGSSTPVLKAVWDVYNKGGVIGGTSAGAAIMSETMIGAGTSMGALQHGVVKNYTGDDFPEDDGVLITRGLGFFPGGIVDQHFLVRARIGRLAVALLNEKIPGNLAFGVDENTAILYNSPQNRFTVAGASGILILDGANATLDHQGPLASIYNISVSYLEENDQFDLTTGKVIPAPGKEPVVPSKEHPFHYSGQTGILSGTPDTFRELLIEPLLDPEYSDTLHNLNFTGSELAFRVSLSRSATSAGFSSKNGHNRQYTLTGIRMDIVPVRVSVTPVNTLN
ncbi:MAG TPA: cyanophycinase [Bacteroidales bacterium]|nr:cyanophycinase [Bacteroidales bacterium]